MAARPTAPPDLRIAVLAGGSGTRFWPLGRRSRPKQVLALDGDDQRPLFAATLDRLLPLTNEAPWVVAPRGMATALRVAAGRHDYTFVGEPQPRNTAVAVALAALLCRQEAPGSVLLVVPADHHVAPLAGYRAALRAMAERAAASEALVTLGLVPDHAATGYGWLEVGRKVAGTRALPVQRVAHYVEKPSLAVAKRLLADGKHRWNGGTFAFRPEVFLAEARRLLPKMVGGLEGALAVRTAKGREAALARLYRALAPVSVDHGIFEKAHHVETVAAAISWDDLGSFDALARHRAPDAHGNRVRGRVTLVDVEGCVVEAAHGHVALLGVKDLIVVRTKDTLLVLPRGQGERVREIVARLEAEGRGDLLM